MVIDTIHEDDDINPMPGWTLQAVMVNCGKCKACGRGKNRTRTFNHGPYWYAYSRGGRGHKPLKSKYIGKVLPHVTRDEA